MSNQSRKIFRGIVSRLSKSPMLYGASNAIENASIRAQIQLNNMQDVASTKYDSIVKSVNGATIIQDLNAASLQPSPPIPRSLLNWWRWYRELTGIQDIEVAQQRVIVVQNKLFDCQDKRRSLNERAGLIAEKLKEVYGELLQTRRDDPKYVQLTIMENKGLQEQSTLSAQLRLLENAERDHFTQLATAIKEYHDSQTMNAQKYKYLSILASAAIAIISLCASMIYNNRRIRDMRIAIADAQRQNEATFKEYFYSLEKQLARGFSNVQNTSKPDNPIFQPIKSDIPMQNQPIKSDIPIQHRPIKSDIPIQHQPIKSDVPIQHQPTKSNIPIKYQPVKSDFQDFDVPEIFTPRNICIGVVVLLLCAMMSSK